MTERQEQMIYDEGRRRGFNDGYEACRDELAEKMMERIADDGTLVIGVKDATKVTRVLVEDDKKNGDLYYADKSEEYEWCHDCKEYDTEKHRCPRWNKVIRQTVEELKADRQQGKWKAKGFHEFFCDNCGFSFDMMKCEFLENMKYCPNCGVRKGSDDEA